MRWYITFDNHDVVVGGFSTQQDARIALEWVEKVVGQKLRVEAR